MHELFSGYDSQNKFEDLLFDPLNKLESEWSLKRLTDYKLKDGVSAYLDEVSIENAHQGQIEDFYSIN